MRFLITLTLVFVSAPAWPVKNETRPSITTFVENRLKSMTLKQKVGQLLIVGFQGTTSKEEAVRLIEKLNVGGLILFSKNIRDNTQVASLTAALQKSAVKNMGIPLLIATDQEGGKVARIRKNATVFPGAMAIGATRSRDLAYAAGLISGKELRALGINMNMAPVLDVERAKSVSVIGVRSFGENPLLVGELGRAFIEGLESQKVLSTAKHFPGHGEVSGDSHFTTPVCRSSEAEIKAIDLLPYKKAIETSPPSAIMTAHVVFPTLDPSRRPATLSKVIITDILRKRLGYDGLVITDDLEMRGVANVRDPGQAGLMAFEAGADLLMVVWSPVSKKKVFQAIYSAVQKGRISEQRLNESVRRILRAKAEHDLFQEPRVMSEAQILARVGTAAHLEVARSIARRSITIIKNENGTLPLSALSKRTIAVVTPFAALGTALQSHHANRVRIFRTSFNPTNEETSSILKKLRQWGPQDIVVGMSTAGHVRLLKKLLAEVKPKFRRPSAQEARRVVAVSFDSPRLLEDSANVDAYLCAFSYQTPVPEVAAHVLAGTESAQGSLPIWIHDDSGVEARDGGQY